MPFRRRNLSTACAGFLILVGIIANRWVIGFFLSPDRRIENPLFSAGIAVFDLSLIALGTTLLILRKNPRKMRNAAISALTTAVAIVLCVLGLEVFLRVHPVSERHLLPLFVDPPNNRLRLRSGLNVSARVGRTTIPIRTNSFGMRWNEISRDPPPDRTRIAFVGDSFTFGEWADDIEHSFVGVFDSMIDRQRYEVLNFGVPSYGLLDVRDQLLEDVLPFHPRFLMLMFFDGNDFIDTFLGPSRYRLVHGAPVLDPANVARRVPAALLGNRGVRDANSNRPASGIRGVVFSSRIYRTLRTFQDRYLESARPRDFVPAESFMSFSFWSRTDYPPVAAAAVDTTLRVLDEIWTVCRRNGVTLMLAAIPCSEQVYAKESSGDGYNILLPQRYLADYAHQRSIPFLDLLPILRAHTLHTHAPLYIPGDAHLNSLGHLTTGVALVSFFQDLMARNTPRAASSERESSPQGTGTTAVPLAHPH